MSQNTNYADLQLLVLLKHKIIVQHKNGSFSYAKLTPQQLEQRSASAANEICALRNAQQTTH